MWPYNKVFLNRLLLPLALQPTVGFGLSNNVLQFFIICHQLAPSSQSQYLKMSYDFLFPSFPGSSPSSRPPQFLSEDLLGILSSSILSRWFNQLILCPDKVSLNSKRLNCLLWSYRHNHQDPINMNAILKLLEQGQYQTLKVFLFYTYLRDATKFSGHQYAQLVCNHHTVLCKQPTCITNCILYSKIWKGKNKTKQQSNVSVFSATKPLRIWGQNTTSLFNDKFQYNGMTGMFISLTVENTGCFKNWESKLNISKYTQIWLSNKERPTWCHLFYYYFIQCSTCFGC